MSSPYRILGPQIDVPAFEVVAHDRRHAREREHRLGHVIPQGVGFVSGTRHFPRLGVAGARAEHDAVSRPTRWSA